MFAFSQVRLASSPPRHVSYVLVPAAVPSLACLSSPRCLLPSLRSAPLQPALPPLLFPSPQMPKMEKLCGHLSLKEAEPRTEKNYDRGESRKAEPTGTSCDRIERAIPVSQKTHIRLKEKFRHVRGRVKARIATPCHPMIYGKMSGSARSRCFLAFFVCSSSLRRDGKKRIIVLCASRSP